MRTSFLLALFDSWFSAIVDFILGFFAIIPNSVYFLYASVCSLLDLFQYVIRKLAGLDVYYVNGEKQQGDILVEFIEGILGVNGSHGAQYQTLSTVFWSLVIFGAILVVLTTIITLIKAHYNYDSKKSQPYEIIKGGIKALFTMTLVPLVTVFGLYFSQIILSTLDELTSSSSGTSVAELYGSETQHLQVVGESKNGNKIYASYDFFGWGAATTQTTFSGALFKIAARDCNRVRQGTFTPRTSPAGYWDNWTDCGIFLGDEETTAMRIDEAFASNLHLVERCTFGLNGEAFALSSAYVFGSALLPGFGLIEQNSFSKYNVGLVYYYYNLFGFNFFLAFAGVAAFFTLMINIIFGLMTRLIYCIALFLIYAPIVGIGQLDGNKAFGNWKKSFIENILMAYGTVVGMNIFFLILPFLDTISFFDNVFLDQIMNLLFMMAALVLVKKFMALISGFIGASDANTTGNDVAEGVKKIGMSGAKSMMGAAKVGIGVAGLATKGKLGLALAPGAKGAGKGLKALGKKIGSGVQNSRTRKALGLSKEQWAGMSDTEKQTARQRFGDRQALLKQGNVDPNTIKQTFRDVGKNDEDTNAANIASLVVQNNDAIYQREGLTADEIAKKRAEENENGGETVHQGVNPQKAQTVGKAFLDVGGSMLKLAGDLTGITKFGKDLEETGGVLSAGKSAIQTFLQNVGKMNKTADGKWDVPAGLMTKEQKDAAEKATANAQREAIESQAKTSRETLDAIKKLTAAIEKNKIK